MDHLSDTAEYQESKPKGIRNKKKACILLLLFGSCLLCALIVPILFFRGSFIIGNIKVNEVVLTNGVDRDGTHLPSKDVFSTEEPRIYCYVSISSPKPVLIGVRWYKGSTLIFEDQEMVDRWRAFYIEPLQGTVFNEGEYRVEVFLVDKSVRTIYFSIEK